MIVRCRSTLALLLASATGCMDGNGNVPLHFPEESAGFALISNGSPDDVAQIWRIDSVPSLAIGGIAADNCASFTAVGSISTMANNEIIVAEVDAGEVRVFDAAGRCRASLGRKGDGPGEFPRRFTATGSGSDTVLVLESVPSFRVSIFSLHRGYLDRNVASRETLVGMGGVGERSAAVTLLGADRLLLKTSAPGPEEFPPGEISVRDSSTHLILDRAFNLERSIGRWPKARAIRYQYRNARGGLVVVGTAPLHVSHTYDASDPSGVRTCIGDSFQPAVSCFDRGAGGLNVTWRTAAIRTSKAEVDEYFEQSAEIGVGMPDFDANGHAAFLRRLEVPPHQPFYNGVMVDAELNLWVRPQPALPADSGTAAWLVFSREGKLRARAFLPEKVRTPVVFGDYLLGSVLDTLGVIHVVKMRILKGM